MYVKRFRPIIRVANNSRDKSKIQRISVLLGLRQDFVTIIIRTRRRRRRTFLKRLSGNDLGARQSEKTRIKINIDLKKLKFK